MQDEAFALWKTQWQSIYARDSEGWQTIQQLHDSFWLICLVDNDYIGGDLFAFVEKLIA